MKHIGNELRRIIEEKQLVKRQIAQKLGISASQFGQELHRESMDAHKLENICKIIGISPGFMFDDWPTSKYTIDDISRVCASEDGKGNIGSEIKLLERLLDEKERTIRILMSGKGGGSYGDVEF